MDYRATMRALTAIQKDQFPYAYAKALTETAKVAQHVVRLHTKDRFKLHTDYIPRGVLIEPALKRELIQFGSTSSAVLTSRAITPFMAWHETGGIKRPRGKMLTTPGPHIKKYSWKTGTGAVRQSYKPRTLLRMSKPSTVGQRKKGRLSRKPFIIDAQGSRPALVVRRVQQGDRGLEILYTFQPSAKIKPVWQFEELVRRSATRNFESIFADEWKQALATIH